MKHEVSCMFSCRGPDKTGTDLDLDKKTALLRALQTGDNNNNGLNFSQPQSIKPQNNNSDILTTSRDKTFL